MINGVVSEIDIIKANPIWEYIRVPTPAIVADGQHGYVSVIVTNTGDEQWWPWIHWQVSVVGGGVISDFVDQWSAINPGETYDFTDWTHILTFHLGSAYQIEIALYSDWISGIVIADQLNPLTTVIQGPSGVHITFPAIPTARKL